MTFGAQTPPVGQLDGDAIGIVDDVVIREDVAVAHR